ncbi:MAG TPA: hypothetical protein VIM55_02720 [Mucilaginibacter sp.]
MITPDNELPIDDSFENDPDDQQSQQDVHSNGLDDFEVDELPDEQADTDKLRRAYDASESSYTLHLGDGPADDDQ